jgi:hypothetical protein
LDIGTFIAVVVTALETVAIAIFAIPTIQAYRKQVQIGQAQVKVSQEQQYNQFRPILYPGGDLEKFVDRTSGKIHVQWGYQNQEMAGLCNIGVGPAFNIYGVLFGPPVNSQPPQERYVLWNYPALSPGVPGDKITLSPGSSIASDTTIKGFTLYVPDDEDHVGTLARFTLTYHDVFGRKHASIYDYHSVMGWISRGHFSDIEKDVYELDQEAPATKMSNQFYYRLGKIAQQ